MTTIKLLAVAMMFSACAAVAEVSQISPVAPPTITVDEAKTIGAFRNRLEGNQPVDRIVKANTIIWSRADGSSPPKIIDEKTLAGLMKDKKWLGWSFFYGVDGRRVWVARRLDLYGCDQKPPAPCATLSILYRAEGSELVEVRAVEELPRAAAPPPAQSSR